jgi:hypothetical protein
VFLAAFLVVRGVPALLHLRTRGRRSVIATGLLQATSLPFIVTASQIGVELGEISPVTGAALVFAGLLSVLFFPVTAPSLLRKGEAPTPESADRVPLMSARV